MMAYWIPNELYFQFIGIARCRVGQESRIQQKCFKKFDFSKASRANFKGSFSNRRISASNEPIYLNEGSLDLY